MMIIQDPFPPQLHSHGMPKAQQPISPPFPPWSLRNKSIFHVTVLYITRVESCARFARNARLRKRIITVGWVGLDYVVWNLRHFGVRSKSCQGPICFWNRTMQISTDSQQGIERLYVEIKDGMIDRAIANRDCGI
jgi:hypothetical protein